MMFREGSTSQPCYARNDHCPNIIFNKLEDAHLTILNLTCILHRGRKLAKSMYQFNAVSCIKSTALPVALALASKPGTGNFFFVATGSEWLLKFLKSFPSLTYSPVTAMFIYLKVYAMLSPLI